jgi:hypothetical protein
MSEQIGARNCMPPFFFCLKNVPALAQEPKVRHGLLQNERALPHRSSSKRPAQGPRPGGIACGIQQHTHGLLLPLLLLPPPSRLIAVTRSGGIRGGGGGGLKAKGSRQDLRGGVEGGTEGPQGHHGAKRHQQGGHAGDGGLGSRCRRGIGEEGGQVRRWRVRVLLLRAQGGVGVRPQVAAHVGVRCCGYESIISCCGYALWLESFNQLLFVQTA